MRFTFRTHERLRRPADFSKARRQGQKRVGRLLVVWAYNREEAPPHAARLGVAVSRKNGGAVQRNLFKRRVREIFRLNKHRLRPGWDLVVSPKAERAAPGDFPADQSSLCGDFLELVRRAGALAEEG